MLRKRPLSWYFYLTFIITWGIAALYFAANAIFDNVFGDISLTHPLFITAVWGPNIAAVILAAVLGKWAGVVRLLKKFIPVRTNLYWYLLALGLFPLAGILINLLSGDPIKLLKFQRNETIMLLVAILVTGPIGEELGWRGFALPRMLGKRSALGAGLLLGLVWGLWHFPSFFMSGLPQMGAKIPVFILAAVALSVIVTWIFVNTKQNVFISFLLHLSVNFTYMLIGTNVIYLSILQVILAVLLAAVYGRNLKIKSLYKLASL